MKRLLQAGAVTVLAALVGLLGWQLTHRDAGARFAAAVDRGDAPAAPDFRLPYLDRSGELTLASLRGRPVVVNFWASWCTGCSYEARLLDRLAAKWQKRGVAFVGVDQEDLVASAVSFARRYQVQYALVHEAGDSTKRSYGVTAYPETYVIDRQGRAIAHFAAALDGATATRLEAALRRAGGRA